MIAHGGPASYHTKFKQKNKTLVQVTHLTTTRRLHELERFLHYMRDLLVMVSAGKVIYFTIRSILHEALLEKSFAYAEYLACKKYVPEHVI